MPADISIRHSHQRQSVSKDQMVIYYNLRASEMGYRDDVNSWFVVTDVHENSFGELTKCSETTTCQSGPRV